MNAPGFALALLAACLCHGLCGSALGQSCDKYGPRVECGTPAPFRGNLGVSQSSCEKSGCCWDPIPLDLEPWQPDVYIPPCFQPNGDVSGYALEQDDIAADGASGNATLTNMTSALAALGTDIPNLSMTLEEVSPEIVRVRITDANTSNPRWEPPAEFFAPGSVLSGDRPRAGAGPRAWEAVLDDAPFSLAVQRVDPATGQPSATLFNSSGLRLVFKDQYIEVSTWVAPTAHLYGAGERSSETTYITRNGYPYTSWARDQNPQVPMRNTYSSWPYILVLEEDGTAWGALLHTSNGLDMVATEDQFSWRVIGGLIDLYVMTGPTPLDVIDQLTQIVGRPVMQPYWAFGFHQCRYGYHDLNEVESVVSNYTAAKIPLETIWVDIDHMDEYRVFSFDPVNFPLPEMQRFVSELHAGGRKWVPILDPGIKVDPAFGPYLDGLAGDVYIKDVTGENDYIGQVWPGACTFPDFGFNPAADAYWTQQLTTYNNDAMWDGLWIDMNEIANFCTGDICQEPSTEAVINQRGFPQWQCQLQCYASLTSGLSPAQLALTDPPYDIANSLVAAPLNFKALSTLAMHHGGVTDYNAHNLYGLAEARATQASIRKIKGERPFILTRSSYMGSGAYAAKWTGDNNASWADLQWSIPGLALSGMSGIPMIGADICGFSSNTTEELCTRWIELGAWYPFARDHSEKGTSYQELYRWPSVAEVGRNVLNKRMQLLPVFYTLMQSATETGAPLFRPLFLNFPADPLTHTIDRQFMLGETILVSPVLSEGATTVSAYFPQGLWHSLWNASQVVDARAKGTNATLAAPLGSPQAHIRGGAILPLQQAALTTAETKDSPLTLLVALPDLVSAQGADGGGSNQTMVASGYMFNDDGISIEVNTSCCNFLTFNASVQSQGGASAGELNLRFGRPSDTQQCAGTGDGTVTWPALSAVRVLGWQAGMSDATLDVLDPASGAVLTSVPINSTQVTTDGHEAVIDLSNDEVTLECSDSVRLRWATATPAPAPQAAG